MLNTKYTKQHYIEQMNRIVKCIKFGIEYEDKEIIVDNFAGGGGASTGIEMATGYSVDIAINHDPEAIKMHKANHPSTKHYCESVWDVDPLEACEGRPVALAWFSPDCFAKGTLILTESGYQPIESLKIGDKVLTHNGNWKSITATMTSEKKSMIIAGYGNTGLVCSEEHPFLTKHCPNVWKNEIRQYRRVHNEMKWTKAKDITEDMYWSSMTSVNPLPIPAMEKLNNKSAVIPIDERLMWLAGRYVGDGWTRITDTRAELVIVCGSHEVTYLKGKLNAWPRKSVRCKDGELSWTYRNVRTGGQFSTNNRGLVKWLRGNFGHTALNKSIPSWLYGAPESFKKAFLSGYLSADGWENKNKVECSTVSKKLAYGLRTLTVTMGYSSTIYLQNKVNNAIEGRIVNSHKIYKVRWKTFMDEMHKQTFVEDGYLWTPIKDVKETGKVEKFYNISVEDDETYIAEGIVVHNCKHFSKAKGGTPVEKEIRGLAWVAVRWAETVRPRVIMLENVEEFQTWGPLRAKRDAETGRCLVKEFEPRGSKNEKKKYRTRVANPGEIIPLDLQLMEPDPRKKGKVFKKFIHALETLGYKIEYRELIAADYGAPTTRKRFFLIARCDDQPIVWPKPTHGPLKSKEVAEGILQPYVGAYTQIDFSLPCPSIFDTEEEIKEKFGLRAQRPLAPKTMERIARGLKKFVIDNQEPFIVQVNHSGASSDYCKSTNEPLSTITAKHGFGIVEPYMVQIGQTGFTADRSKDIREPLTTIVSKNEHCLVETKIAPIIDKAYGGNYKGGGSKANEPLDTITTVDHNRLVEARLAPFMGVNTTNHPGGSCEEPLHTITTGNQQCLISPTLIQYHSDTSKDDVHGQKIEEALMETDAVKKYGLVESFLSRYYDNSTKKEMAIYPHLPGSEWTPPSLNSFDISTSCLIQMNNNCDGRDIKEPIPTITAGDGHFGEVRAFLIKYYGQGTGQDIKAPLDTITAQDRFGLVTIEGVDYQIVDIGLRMLEPKELYGCQGFPEDYIIDRDYTGKKYPRSEQVRRCGNAVCPPIPAALVKANLPKLCVAERMPNIKINTESTGQLRFA